MAYGIITTTEFLREYNIQISWLYMFFENLQIYKVELFPIISGFLISCLGLSKGKRELGWNYKMASTSVRDLDCRADPADAREPLYFLNMEAVPPPSPPKKPRLHTI